MKRIDANLLNDGSHEIRCKIKMSFSGSRTGHFSRSVSTMTLDSCNTCSSFTSASSCSLSLSPFLSHSFISHFVGNDETTYPDDIRWFVHHNFVFSSVLKYSSPRAISLYTTDLVSSSCICPTHFFSFCVLIALLRFNINYKFHSARTHEAARLRIN